MAEVTPRPYVLDGKVIPVFITDEAIAEWEQARARLLIDGYPDRPPDVDTPTTRCWRVHPGETDDGPTPVEIDDGSSPYGSMVVDWPGNANVKMLVTSHDGELSLQIRMGMPDGGYTDKTPPRAITPAQWETMKSDMLAATVAKGYPIEGVMITTADDFEAIKTQWDDLDAAIAKWYATHMERSVPDAYYEN